MCSRVPAWPVGDNGWSGGHAPPLCPLSDLGGGSPGYNPVCPVVSASEVAAGEWPSLRTSGAAAGGPGWDGVGGDGREGGEGICSRREGSLPPLTSTGGQCSIKVPPDSSALHTYPDGGPWVQESGSASYIWNPWWADTRQGGLGDAESLGNQFCLFVFFFVLI